MSSNQQVAQQGIADKSMAEHLIEHLVAQKDKALIVIVTANYVIRDIYAQDLLYRAGSGIKRYSPETGIMAHKSGGVIRFFQMNRVLHGALRGLDITMGVFDPTGASFQAPDVKGVVYKNLHNAVFMRNDGFLIQAVEGRIVGSLSYELSGPIPQLP